MEKRLDFGGFYMFIEKGFIRFIIFIVLLTFARIFKNQFNRRSRRSKEVIKLNRNFNYLILGLIWFVIFIIWITLFSYRVQETCDVLNEDYIDNVFQLFNMEYLESLRNYFYKNLMISKLLTIVRYQNNLVKMISWILISLSISVWYLYSGWQKNIIYKSGILVNNRFLNWEKIIDYKWSDFYEKGVFEKNQYYDLILEIKKLKFLNLDNEIKIRVDYNKKEFIDNVLKQEI